jgi:probable F420-dependent oxidoreductase
MKLGVVLPHNEIGSDPMKIRDFALGIEALGADHLLVYDHVLGADPDRPGGWRGMYDSNVAFHEPLTFLSFIAGITKTIELVTTVMILPQRQTALVAKQAAELQILSGNRFRLGAGTGWNKIEYEALGIPFEHRGARQAEQIQLLKKFWSEDVFSFEGRFHRVDAAGINPRPTAPIPVWFGGSAKPLLNRCARMGDGWMPLMGANAAAKEAIDYLQSVRAEAGLDWDSFGIQAQAQFAGGSPERWASHYEKWLNLGATHMAFATHNAEPTSVDGHLKRIENYFAVIEANA